MEVFKWPLLMGVHVLKLLMLTAESVPARLVVINTAMLKSFGKPSIKHTYLGVHSCCVKLREVVENHQENAPTR